MSDRDRDTPNYAAPVRNALADLVAGGPASEKWRWPFRGLFTLSEQRERMLAERLAALRHVAYIPDNASSLEAWANVGRYAVENHFDILNKKPRGRPRKSETIDFRRALVVSNILNSGAASDVKGAIKMRAAAGDELFPVDRRGERTLENSVSRGIREIEFLVEHLHELTSIAREHGDKAALDEAAEIIARLNQPVFS